MIAQFQREEFDRCIERYEDRKLGADSVLRVLENAVAEAVSGHVTPSAWRGRGRGRPEVPGFLVAKVQGFPARFAYRIVAPWREAKELGVLAPRIAKAAFRHDRTEARVREHIHPGSRCRVARGGRDDVFATVRRKASEAVEEDQIIPARLDRGGSLRAMRSGRHQSGNSHSGRGATVDLVRERAAVVGDDRAGDRPVKNAVVIGYLLGMPNEDAPGSIDDMGLDAGSDQPDDLFLEPLPVAVATLVPDHQVHGQSLEAPVRMRLH